MRHDEAPRVTFGSSSPTDAREKQQALRSSVMNLTIPSVSYMRVNCIRRPPAALQFCSQSHMHAYLIHTTASCVLDDHAAQKSNCLA